MLLQVASFILLGNGSKHHLPSPWMILSFPNQWSTLSGSTFSNSRAKIAGSLQHQTSYRSYQVLWLAIRTKLRVYVVFFFFFSNISALSTIAASVYVQHATIKPWGRTRSCVGKFARWSRRRSIRTNGGGKSHMKINSSGTNCAVSQPVQPQLRQLSMSNKLWCLQLVSVTTH